MLSSLLLSLAMTTSPAIIEDNANLNNTRVTTPRNAIRVTTPRNAIRVTTPRNAIRV